MNSSYCARSALQLLLKQQQPRVCCLSTARVPMIKFIGKRSLAQGNGHHASISAPAASTAPVATTAAAPKAVSAPMKAAVSKSPVVVKVAGNGVDMTSIKDGAWFGRPRPSKAEIDAIELGGASTIW